MFDLLRDRLAPAHLDYHEGWALQRRVHADVVAGVRPPTLILCEHEAVYTAGRRTQPEDRPVDATPVVDIDRGGRITWHGPGQLTGYPIVRLMEPGPTEPGPTAPAGPGSPAGRGGRPAGRATGMDVVAFVRDLEAMMIEVAARHGVEGERVEGRSGVWVRTPHGYDKIGAIGLRVQDGVTMHGFALNCSNSLAAYEAIVPCGISDAGVATLSQLTGRRIEPADVVDDVVDAFGRLVRFRDAAEVAA